MKQNRVAIVEDWDIYLEGLALLLERYGCNVVIKANKLLELAEQLSFGDNLPDTCIVNIACLLKEEDIFQKLRLQYPGIKMIAYSSNENAPTIEEAMKKGIDRYLLRSDRLEDALATVDTKPEALRV
ncbi:MAG: response regulator transcription factor [Bacteroidetes bacterium]|nr:response regulator transcription factor [Bacteroidota bacterium]